MKANEFLKRRSKIEGKREKQTWWHRRAFDALIREAQAVPVVSNRRVIAYKLGSGEIVCVKTRFRTADAATSTLQMIQLEHQPRQHEPVRAYSCDHCKGWHITSMK